MAVSPFFRSPLTDLTGGLISHQMLGRCQKEEMRYMDCLEAYGLERAMRDERDRQIAEGKLKGDKQFVNPKVDSY